MNFSKTEFYKSYGRFDQLPPPRKTEIAFSGRSNVGKSTLINKLCNRKSLAKASSTPGKTTTVNFYALEDMFLVDLPGYGYAKRSKDDKARWSSLVGGYLTSGRDIALVFQLIDMRHPPSAGDMQMIDFMVEAEMPFAIVLTKADKLSRREQAERKAAFLDETGRFDEIVTIPFSAVTGDGVGEIRAIIEEFEQ
jgi:GTP-binding protein